MHIIFTDHTLLLIFSPTVKKYKNPSQFIGCTKMGHRSDLTHRLQFAKHCRYEHLSLCLNHQDIFFSSEYFYPYCCKIGIKRKHQELGLTPNTFLLYFQNISGDIFLKMVLHLMEEENWHVLSIIEHQCRHKKFSVPYLTQKAGNLSRKIHLSNGKRNRLRLLLSRAQC